MSEDDKESINLGIKWTDKTTDDSSIYIPNWTVPWNITYYTYKTPSEDTLLITVRDQKGILMSFEISREKFAEIMKSFVEGLL